LPDAEDGDQSTGLMERQRPQRRGIDDGVDSRPNLEKPSTGRNKGERLRLPKRPNPVAEILRDGFQEPCSANVVTLISKNCEIPERPIGDSTSLRWVKSALCKLLRLHLEMGFHLLADLVRNGVTTPEGAKPSQHNPPEGHLSTSPEA
jgi:hypothetical protein